MTTAHQQQAARNFAAYWKDKGYEKGEREGHIFVIRPEIPTVGRAEANKEKLIAFYQHGYDVMKDHYEELQAYLSR